MNNFIPKETYTKISDISIDYLINDKKIKGLIFDFDGTLKINKKISIETLNFIKKVQNSGLKLSILSNNPYVNKTLLKTLNINTTKKFACKPLKKPFILMAQKMNLDPKEIAVIGNNKLFDIFGANRANMYSIYIQNLNNYFLKKKIKNNLKIIGINKLR